jgi:hypothetical protein
MALTNIVVYKATQNPVLIISRWNIWSATHILSNEMIMRIAEVLASWYSFIF